MNGTFATVKSKYISLRMRTTYFYGSKVLLYFTSEFLTC